MPPSKKYALHVGGGLGDIILTYLHGYQGWGYYRSLKTKDPTCKIKLIITSKNPLAHTLFEHDPHINQIRSYPWENPMYYTPKEIWKYFPKYRHILWKDPNNRAKEHILLDRNRKLFNSLKKETPNSLFLSQNDKKQVDTIKQKSYVVLHPFAAGKERIVPDIEDYYKIAKEIISRFGYSIVVLGNNNKPQKPQGEYFEEDFPYTDKKIINLVNKTNLRVNFKLVQRAIAFIGTASCYFCIGVASNRLPAIGFIPPEFESAANRRMEAWSSENTKAELIVAGPKSFKPNLASVLKKLDSIK